MIITSVITGQRIRPRIRKFEVQKASTLWRKADGNELERPTGRWNGRSYQFWRITWASPVTEIHITAGGTRTAPVTVHGQNVVMGKSVIKLDSPVTSTNFYGDAAAGYLDISVKGYATV